ncbi:hypothetical protein BROUX41_005065 [Berkeleyomyces rouxiae]|uniref:uncharacterized protein n=1 Tax=Berkeleyomyces rouxiae TaxID=2035830 RepID=UPI003B7D64EC
MAYLSKPDGVYPPMPPSANPRPTDAPLFWTPEWQWDHPPHRPASPHQYPVYNPATHPQPMPQTMVFPVAMPMPMPMPMTMPQSAIAGMAPHQHQHQHAHAHGHLNHHVSCCGLFGTTVPPLPPSPTPTASDNVVLQAEVREVPRWNTQPRHTYKITLGPSTTVDYLVTSMGVKSALDIRVHLSRGHSMLLSEFRGRHDLGMLKRPGVWFEVLHN